MALDAVSEICEVAARHDLRLNPATVEIHDAGLDFRVGIGATDTGERWVLRVPRREGMGETIAAEAAILDLAGRKLSVAVPEWRIRTPELVAYPALPGEPGLRIGSDGELDWKLDLASPTYAAAFGKMLAELHALDVEEARAAGIPIESPAEVREGWRRDIEKVQAEFEVSEVLRRRWEAWLGEDSYWPTWSVFTHGELYPAHVLIDAEERITGVIDWTTAKVSDPARDFLFQQAMSPPEVFEITLRAYEEAGGKTWPRLEGHAAEMWSASPVLYGLFALETGDESHRSAAQAQLNPET